MNTFSAGSRNVSRGIGALTVIGGAILIILFLLSVTSSFFTAGVSNISAQVTCGEQAVLVARAAIAEVLAIIEASAKVPDNRIYFYLRLPLTSNYSGKLKFEGDIKVAPSKVRSMTAGNPAIRFINVRARIPWQLRLYRYLPYEKYGRLHITADVGIDPGAGYKRVVRSVEHVYEFKIAAPLPPKPFDSVTALTMTMKAPLELYERNYRIMQQNIDRELADAEDEAGLDRGRLGRPFQDNPRENIYRAFPDYRYPPYPLNDRAGPGPLDSRDTDMDNPIFVRENPFNLRNLKLVWPESADNVVVGVSYVQQGGTIRVCEGMEGTTSFQQGEVITIRMPGGGAVDAVLNGRADAVDVTQRQGTDSQGNPVNDIEIALRGTPNSGFANDIVTISGGQLTDCQILYRGQPVHEIDSQVQDQIQRLEAAIQSTLDNYGFTFRPIAEDFVEQFKRELALQLSWEGYVTRATQKFDRPADFIRYVKRGSVWNLDGIYLVRGPLTINTAYRGNGVIVNRGGPVTILRARAKNPQRDTLTVISTSNDILLGGDDTVEASLIAARGTVKGLMNQTIVGNVVVGYFERPVYNNNPAGVVEYNQALQRSKPGTGDVNFKQYRFYLNRQPLITSIRRKEL